MNAPIALHQCVSYRWTRSVLEFVQKTRNFSTRLTQWKITNWLQSKITDTTVNLAGKGKELKIRCFKTKHIVFIGSNLCVLSLVRMNPACILRKCLVFPSLQFLPVSTIYILIHAPICRTSHIFFLPCGTAILLRVHIITWFACRIAPDAISKFSIRFRIHTRNPSKSFSVVVVLCHRHTLA